MTQVEWEKIFLDNLTAIPDAERFKMAEYYREMYGDKLESGQSPGDILAEFGDPKECAERILRENESASESVTQEIFTPPSDEQNAVFHESNENSVKKGGYWTPSTIVGMALLTVLLIVPLCGGALGVLAGLAAVALAGGVVAVAGCVYVIAAPFMGFTGASIWAIVANLGGGFVMCGVGVLLLISGYFATKYAFIGCKKALLWIYKRGK